MGQRLYVRVALLTAMAFPAWAGELGTSAVQILAMGHFESHANSSVDECLTQTRPAPLTSADCDEVIASPPKDGELQAKPAELAKIDAPARWSSITSVRVW